MADKGGAARLRSRPGGGAGAAAARGFLGAASSSLLSPEKRSLTVGPFLGGAPRFSMAAAAT